MIPGLQMIPDREWSLNWTADLSRACRKHSGFAFSRLSANGSLLTSNWDVLTPGKCDYYSEIKEHLENLLLILS